MKKRNFIAFALGFALYLAMHITLISYGNMKCHPAFNESIVKRVTDSKNEDIYSRYNLNLKDKAIEGMAVTNTGYWDYTTSETYESKYPWDWIAHGGMSADEPEVAAAVRHFYDPLAISGHKYLTNRGMYIEPLYPNPGIDAIEWALGDTPKGSENRYTWEKGKKFIIDALNTNNNEPLKDQLMAKAWRCLGETMHNTADMACPSHVRNDSHAAPLGWSGGSVMGSPDPYEEMFQQTWVGTFADEPIDNNFASFLISAKTVRAINEALSIFTNSNFFSDETIYGNGYSPGNGEKPYPSPRLEDLSYNDKDYTYYKTMPSGRQVKMCKDYRYFSLNGRGKPYIDNECVKSQASELIPYIIAAGRRIFELYIPDIKIVITPNDDEYFLLGKVVHNTSTEFPDEIFYNGKIKLKWNGNEREITVNNGNFNQYIDIKKPTGDFELTLECGGILYKYKPDKSSLQDYKHWIYSGELTIIFSDGKSYNEPTGTHDFTENEIKWVENSFQAKWDTVYGNNKVNSTITFEADKEGKKLLQATIDEYYYYTTKEDNYDLWDERKLHIVIRPLKYDLNFVDIDADQFKMILKGVELNKDSLFSNIASITLTHKFTDPIRDDKNKIIGTQIKNIQFSEFNKNSDKDNHITVAVVKFKK